MKGGYEHVVSFAVNHPWALTREMGAIIAGILARRIAGVEVDRAEIEAALVNRKNLPQPRAGSIAIIPVYGVIAPRLNLVSEMSGGTTFEKLTAQLRAAVADKTIRTIVQDIDSPGSNVAGATEYAHELLKARTKKPIIAQVQYLAASGAYWLAACCTEIVAAPSAIVGSIGAYSIHDDLADALAKEGIKRTYLYAGEGKVDGNETGPLSAEAEARRQASLNKAQARFVGDVVKGRGAGMTADRVKNEWKAYVYDAEDAKALGMIDTIATLDETLARILTTSPDSADQRAARAFLSTDSLPPPDDTSQEPVTATDQDRRPELALERQAFELQRATLN